MFGHRSDGRKLKTLPPFFKVIPNIMPTRDDAQVFFKQDIALSSIEEYINRKAAEGIKLSYMNVIYAAIVRVISQRPELNRFAMNGSIYSRNKIYISLTIKKSLTDEGQETTTKLEFNGTENIFEIKDKLNSIIDDNKKIDTENNTDDIAKMISHIPDGLARKVVKLLMRLDKHGMLPKSIIKASPFHTSAFLTNVGSIGIDSIYHHLYNFGTTSLFFSMGKKKKSFIYEDDEIHEEKCFTIAFVGDERICDGYYYASSFKLLCKYLKKPELLEENVEVKQVEEEVPVVEEKKEEKPNKKSCNCKRQLTTKDVFGYMWMGQIYGE